jgi:cullin-4
MVIKPFKRAPKPPEEFEAKTFDKLHGAVEAVYQMRAADSSLEDLYRAVRLLFA